LLFFFFKQKTAYEIFGVTGVQTCALPIYLAVQLGMVDPVEKDKEGLPLTCRAVCSLKSILFKNKNDFILLSCHGDGVV